MNVVFVVLCERLRQYASQPRAAVLCLGAHSHIHCDMCLFKRV